MHTGKIKDVTCFTLVLNSSYHIRSYIYLFQSHGHSWCVCERGCSDWRGYEGKGSSIPQFLLGPQRKDYAVSRRWMFPGSLQPAC